MCRVTGCREPHRNHYCGACGDKDSDHFRHNCPREPMKRCKYCADRHSANTVSCEKCGSIGTGAVYEPTSRPSRCSTHRKQTSQATSNPFSSSFYQLPPIFIPVFSAGPVDHVALVCPVIDVVPTSFDNNVRHRSTQSGNFAPLLRTFKKA